MSEMTLTKGNLWRPSDVAKVFGITVNTVKKWIRLHNIPHATDINGWVYFPQGKEVIEQFSKLMDTQKN
jgi:uncharacterized protein YjcR